MKSIYRDDAGNLPAVDVPTGKFLKDDGTWDTPGGGGMEQHGNEYHTPDMSEHGHNHDGVYEPADAGIQSHITSQHAPSNAQVNADITKAEIEAKLTGEISSHSHAGGSGAGQLILPLLAQGAVQAWTNMPLALTFWQGSHRHILKVDLTTYTQVRFVVNKQATAGAAASKLILRYLTAFSTTVGNYLDIGTGEVSIAVNTTNNVLATSWIDL